MTAGRPWKAAYEGAVQADVLAITEMTICR